MKSTQKEMIASLVREGRMEKGYTQKELSELSNISVRSIQRIENGEIIPRTYTLKTLAGILGRSYEDFARDMQEQGAVETVIEKVAAKSPAQIGHIQRVILSVGICLSLLVLAGAFIAQSFLPLYSCLLRVLFSFCGEKNNPTNFYA
jgi:transcriptional regulator with XRE-family HTH domain